LANDFFNSTGYPAFNAAGDSASARAEFALIAAAFNKLPTLAGFGLRLVRVNAAGTGLESVTLTTAKILASDGTSTVTANIPLNNFKITGLAAGTANGDSVRYEQLIAHISSVANPHGVTAAQAGAEPANANIQSHITDIANPHSVTAMQVGSPLAVGNIAAMRLLTPVNGATYYLEAHTTAGDGGGGHLRGVTGAAPGTYVDNNGTIIVPTGGDGSAAWLREDVGYVTPEMFGAVGDGVTDDTSALTTFFIFKNLLGTKGKAYITTSSFTLTVDTVFNGNGCSINVGNASTITTLFNITADNVTISDFTTTINTAAMAYTAVAIGATTGSIVERVTVVGDKTIAEASNLLGIVCTGGHVVDTIIRENVLTGLKLGISYCASTHSSNNVKVVNNILNECHFCISGNGSAAFSSKGNVIEGNTITNTSYIAYMGIEDYSGANASTSGSTNGLFGTKILNNTIINAAALANDFSGISAVSMDAEIAGNTILNWASAASIEIAVNSNAKLINNTIKHDVLSTTASGYILSGNNNSSSVTITGGLCEGLNLAVTVNGNKATKTATTQISGMDIRGCNKAFDIQGANCNTSLIGNNIYVTNASTALRNQILLWKGYTRIIGNSIIYNPSSTGTNAEFCVAITSIARATLLGNTFDAATATFGSIYGFYSNGSIAYCIAIGNEFLNGIGVNYQSFVSMVSHDNIISGGISFPSNNKIGFFDTTPIVKPTITGAKGGNAALGSLLTQLSALGLVTDSTTA